MIGSPPRVRSTRQQRAAFAAITNKSFRRAIVRLTPRTINWRLLAKGNGTLACLFSAFTSFWASVSGFALIDRADVRGWRPRGIKQLLGPAPCRQSRVLWIQSVEPGCCSGRAQDCPLAGLLSLISYSADSPALLGLFPPTQGRCRKPARVKILGSSWVDISSPTVLTALPQRCSTWLLILVITCW